MCFPNTANKGFPLIISFVYNLFVDCVPRHSWLLKIIIEEDKNCCASEFGTRYTIMSCIVYFDTYTIINVWYTIHTRKSLADYFHLYDLCYHHRRSVGGLGGLAPHFNRCTLGGRPPPIFTKYIIIWKFIWKLIKIRKSSQSSS